MGKDKNILDELRNSTSNIEYDKLVNRLNAIEKTRIDDAKFLQIMINLAPDVADKAIEIINKHGLNKALAMVSNHTIGKVNKIKRAEIIILSGFINHSIFVADKFIKKVEIGKARSTETYKDLKEIKEEAKFLKKRLNFL